MWAFSLSRLRLQHAGQQGLCRRVDAPAKQACPVHGAAVIYTHIAAAVLGSAIAATTAWGVQDWRLGGQIAALQAQHATERAQAEADARATEIAHNTRLQEAQDAATAREITLRRDAAG